MTWSFLRLISIEEFLIGASLGLMFAWKIQAWAILLAMITGALWERGGSGWLGTKAWRRYGVPTAILLSTMKFDLLTAIAFVTSVVVLSIGYGQRDSTDSGSPFGNWCMDRFGVFWGKWASRFIIVASVWLVWSVVLVIK